MFLSIQDAINHIKQNFTQIGGKQISSSRTWVSWYEVYQRNQGVVTSEDIVAFSMHQKGQHHVVTQLDDFKIQVNCGCDSGD